MLPDEIKPSMQGVIPSTIFTCSLVGVPNATEISQIYYVDEKNVALSHQFFNKTHRNVRENPFVIAILRDPENFQEWKIELRYDHSETEGAGVRRDGYQDRGNHLDDWNGGYFQAKGRRHL